MPSLEKIPKANPSTEIVPKPCVLKDRIKLAHGIRSPGHEAEKIVADELGDTSLVEEKIVDIVVDNRLRPKGSMRHTDLLAMFEVRAENLVRPHHKPDFGCRRVCQNKGHVQLDGVGAKAEFHICDGRLVDPYIGA